MGKVLHDDRHAEQLRRAPRLPLTDDGKTLETAHLVVNHQANSRLSALIAELLSI